MVQRESPDEVGLLNHYALTWQYIADYFNGNPDVAGYEIMNEPWGGSNGVGSYFGAQILTPFYNQVISAIRSVDPSTSVYFEPDLLTTNGLPLTLGTVDDPNTVLSFHDYADKFLPGFGLGAQSASNAVQYGNSHNIPVFLSEFGSTNDYAHISDMLKIADQYRFGWAEWEYTDKGDITTTGGGYGWLVREPDQPPTGDNVDAEKLATLAAPYPQEISGTPTTWSFDSTTGTFQFSYSTERADGLGSFDGGSKTTISTPLVEYPNGYQVSVTGGHVVSEPNAAVLTIASNDGADTVTVTVRPAG
ncbi:cellulase family glycosylhydrolase, partial [Mycolicibacter sinensis]